MATQSAAASDRIAVCRQCACRASAASSFLFAAGMLSSAADRVLEVGLDVPQRHRLVRVRRRRHREQRAVLGVGLPARIAVRAHLLPGARRGEVVVEPLVLLGVRVQPRGGLLGHRGGVRTGVDLGAVESVEVAEELPGYFLRGAAGGGGVSARIHTR